MSVIQHPLRFWAQMPGARLDISRRALDRGLVYLFMGDGTFWTRQSGYVSYVSRNGSPRDVAYTRGLAKAFGATHGGGNTDYLTGPPVALSTGIRSIIWHFQPMSGGGGGLGRLQQSASGNGADAAEAAYLSGGALTYSRYSTGQNQWTIGPSIGIGVPNAYGMTHDQRTASTPVSYAAGLPASTSVLVAPGGTYSTGIYTPAFGNRPSDSQRNFDGWLWRIPIFDHPNLGLQPDEHFELAMDPDSFLFEERPFMIYFPYSAGTTSVVQSFDGDYDIVGRVQTDLSASYAIGGVVQKSFDGSYQILSASAVVSAFDGAYAIQGKVQQDYDSTFNLQGVVAKDLSATFNVKGLVQKDLSASYNILAAEASIITLPFANNSGDEEAVAGETSMILHALKLSDLTSVALEGGHELEEDNTLTFTHGGLEAGEDYALVVKGPNGIGVEIYTAV